MPDDGAARVARNERPVFSFPALLCLSRCAVVDREKREQINAPVFEICTHSVEGGHGNPSDGQRLGLWLRVVPTRESNVAARSGFFPL